MWLTALVVVDRNFQMAHIGANPGAGPTFLLERLAETNATNVYAETSEERDLVSVYGESYKEYQRQVSMLIPLPKKR